MQAISFTENLYEPAGSRSRLLG